MEAGQHRARAKPQLYYESVLTDIEEEFPESYMNDYEDYSDPDSEDVDVDETISSQDMLPVEPDKVELHLCVTSSSNLPLSPPVPICRAKPQLYYESVLTDIEEEFPESYMNDYEDYSDPDSEDVDVDETISSQDMLPVEPDKVELSSLPMCQFFPHVPDNLPPHPYVPALLPLLPGTSSPSPQVPALPTTCASSPPFSSSCAISPLHLSPYIPVYLPPCASSALPMCHSPHLPALLPPPHMPAHLPPSSPYASSHPHMPALLPLRCASSPPCANSAPSFPQCASYPAPHDPAPFLPFAHLPSPMGQLPLPPICQLSSPHVQPHFSPQPHGASPSS
ncbi:Hypothetical predicted protein [Pelobates cultripes]|uniref:Uncharacterized protein n=1 Tax=Pelobates cultripes TaxID=61616 RepID=A0AAD1T8P3_PELCU|nr:Hypothetical predicted protein [Pelobates cultripes]